MTGKIIEEIGVYTPDIRHCKKIGIKQKLRELPLSSSIWTVYE